MSHRLQVLLDEAEMEEVRRMARRQRLTVAEWVRRALRRARIDEPLREARAKLDSIRRASRHSFPTADIERMNAEIEAGYRQ